MAYLLPPARRRHAEETLDDIGRALRLWLLGQAVQMCVIGALSTAAVWIIGLPSPLALGAIAGLAEFIPYLGPVIASIPAILVAVTNGFYPALWTIVAYSVIDPGLCQGSRRVGLHPPSVVDVEVACSGAAGWRRNLSRKSPPFGKIRSLNC
jgi:hypothetical protein